MAAALTLRDRVEWFVATGGHRDDLRALLKEAVSDRSLEALLCVSRLYEDMYGGLTHNMELKAPAAATMLVWQAVGLQALVEAARKNPKSENLGIAIEILALVAAGDSFPSYWALDVAIEAEIAGARHGLVAAARTLLVEMIMSFPDDEDVARRIGSTLTGFSFDKGDAAQELFVAVSKRWLAVSTPLLQAFDQLIEAKPCDETAFQQFLSDHPQILDPLAFRVWPQPDLFGFKEPDFVVQRADGTYIVVEIECPGKTLVTAGGHLSADVTHAEQQATDYRRNLMRKYADVRIHMPDFQEPDCLVVLGLQRTLSKERRQILHDANLNRNHLRIAGFDWLLNRGRTIATNVTRHGVETIPLQVV
jgi:hypothetical protein